MGCLKRANSISGQKRKSTKFKSSAILQAEAEAIPDINGMQGLKAKQNKIKKAKQNKTYKLDTMLHVKRKAIPKNFHIT